MKTCQKKGLLFALLVLLLVTSQGQGCQCPSCQFSNAAQNCQCCVFRQLGKRQDPTFSRHLPVSANEDLSRDFRQPIYSDLAPAMSYAQSVASDDWLPKRHAGFYYNNDVSSDMTSKLSAAVQSRMEKGWRGTDSVKPERFVQLGLLEKYFDLARALRPNEDEERFEYN